MKFSEETIKSNFLVREPEWYGVKCTKHNPKPSAKKDSTNHFYTFEVVETKEGDDLECMMGVPVLHLVNDKEDFGFLPIVKAMLGGKNPDPDTDYQHKDVVGVEFDAYIERDKRYNSQDIINVISQFAPRGEHLK